MAKNAVAKKSKQVLELEARIAQQDKELAEAGKKVTVLEMNQKKVKGKKTLGDSDGIHAWIVADRLALSMKPLKDPLETQKDASGKAMKDADGNIIKIRIQKKSGNPSGGLINIIQCDPNGIERQTVQLYPDQVWFITENVKTVQDFLIKALPDARTYQHKSSATISHEDTAPDDIKAYWKTKSGITF